MSERPSRPNGVTGPTGKPLTVEILPPPDTIRWTIWRKAEVVAAVRNGLLGLDEACERYRLSAEEFLNWEQLIAAHGLRGLKATRLREYRQSERDQPDMPFDNPSTPVLHDNLLADICVGARAAKTWSLRQTGLFVVTMSTVLWGVIIFVVRQMVY